MSEDPSEISLRFQRVDKEAEFEAPIPVTVHHTGSDSESFKAYSNLAGLYLNQKRLDEAEDFARRALAILETLDPSGELWKPYSVLAGIAGERDRSEEARSWRRKEQDARLRFEAVSQADTDGPGVRQAADRWDEVVTRILAACQSGRPDPDLDQFLMEVGQKDDWKNLAAALQRLLSGERGLDLFDGLDDVDSAVLRRVLKGLMNGAAPAASDADAPSPPRGEGLTLPQLLELVERVVRGDHALGGELFPMFQRKSYDASAPPELRALSAALARVLVGERNPDLVKLPPEMASAVRGLLGRLKNG